MNYLGLLQEQGYALLETVKEIKSGSKAITVVAAGQFIGRAETALGLCPIFLILGPMAQPVPSKRCILALEITNLRVELWEKFGVGFSNVLSLRTQVELGKQQLQPSCGYFRMRNQIALPEDDG